MTHHRNPPDNSGQPGQPPQDHFGQGYVQPHVQQHVPPQWQSQGHGQVRPYYPPQPPQGWQPYAPPRPAVQPKSPGTALLMSIFIPGSGMMYAEHPGWGIAILLMWLISIPLVFIFFIGVITGFACWVTGMILGYTLTKHWNQARGLG